MKQTDVFSFYLEFLLFFYELELFYFTCFCLVISSDCAKSCNNDARQKGEELSRLSNLLR